MLRYMSLIIILVAINYAYIRYKILNLPDVNDTKDTVTSETVEELDVLDILESNKYDSEHVEVNKDVTRDEAKIMGGSEVLIEMIPYQAALWMKGGNSMCGGSIIRDNVVVTAAHCTDGKKPSQIAVKTGTTDIYENNQTVLVEQIIQHEKYKMISKNIPDFDISLLILTKKLTFNKKVQPIRLPHQGQEFLPQTVASTSGWGHISQVQKRSRNLRQIFIPILSTEKCTQPRGLDALTERIICAGSPGKDSCAGDSGGPLVVNGVLVGITSFGQECIESQPFYPGGWTKISIYVAWIEHKLLSHEL